MRGYGLRGNEAGHAEKSKRCGGMSVAAAFVTAMLVLEGLVICGMLLLLSR